MREEVLGRSTINIRIEIAIFEYAENEQCAENEEGLNELIVRNNVNIYDYPSASYDWKCETLEIFDARDVITPKIHSFQCVGLQWQAALIGRDLYLILQDDEYDIVSLRCFMELVEMNIKYVSRCILTPENPHVGWGDDRVDPEQFSSLIGEKEELTLRFTMELISAYKNGQDVTQQVIEKFETKEHDEWMETGVYDDQDE